MKFDVSKLDLKKGDTLVMKCKGAVSEVTALRLKRQMEKFVKKKKVRVLVICNGIDFYKLKDGQLVSLDRERFV